MLSSTLYTIFTFVSLLSVVASSAITTYTDGTCQKSFNNLNDVVNGYPDGVCTALNITSNLQAFQIARLDPGCAGAQRFPSLICCLS
jgi:hypothetical protein